ncbi:MAG TPA: type II toxin-antitoxin system prevent-host-death family antitoxin [Burkholderiales bacterium]|jgi:prevent-host-death family protein|nr:type II toxin-antitoxin system prevent-host-death family antitoxin [Burkholderiales bacterium]
MASVKVSELRQKLPAYLARVRRGERLQVTARGKVIAEIVAPTAPASEADAARARLRGSVLRFDKPLDPVFDPAEWDMNR